MSTGKAEAQKVQARYEFEDKRGGHQANQSQGSPSGRIPDLIAQKLRHYFYAYTTYLISRMDPLKYIFEKPIPTGKLAKWQILLSEFDIVYVTQKSVKGQAFADHLVENPIDGEYEPLKMYFPNEEVSLVGEDITEAYDCWRMFFDGTANFKGVGIGVVLISETGQHYLNEFADVLATLSSMIQHPDKNFIDPILIGIRKQPAYCTHVKEEFDRNPWFHDNKEYLEKGKYPESATHTQKRMLQRLANS
ncbi:uncharacterized protein [Nicotiana tomentosiformis]|uniref:uncharacterized protein n=1 Tax=Nicotiana tomentosiformis TaxID=4098 RepID=UPI00388C4A92